MMFKCKIITFYGIDGSGKSTQAEKFCNELTRRKYRVKYIWARRVPVFTRVPIKIIKKYLLSEIGNSDGENYLSIATNRKVILERKWRRFVWTRILLLEYLIITRWKFIFYFRNVDFVVVDRYLIDALVDFATIAPDPRKEILSLLQSTISKLFPLTSLNYLIDIPPEIGWKRKSDGTSLEYLIDRRCLYVEALKHHPDAYIVDGIKSIDEIANDVINLFLNQLKTDE